MVCDIQVTEDSFACRYLVFRRAKRFVALLN